MNSTLSYWLYSQFFVFLVAYSKRRSDKRLLNALNKDIRFPLPGRIATNEEKRNVLLQVLLRLSLIELIDIRPDCRIKVSKSSNSRRTLREWRKTLLES